MAETHENEYTDSFVAALEMVWGDGFLSPGGKEEIDLFLDGLDLTGKTILDVGCGAGGVDIVLVQDYGAKHVLGIDIEQPLMERCIARAERSGLANQISYQKVVPGPFPLDDRTFDVVFSKDAMIHIEDKHALFKEVFRVLRPGGVFVASDWMRVDENPPGPAAQHWIDSVGLSFGMHSPPFYEDALRSSGFEQIRMRDRNEFLIKALSDDIAMFKDKYDELVHRTGEEADHYIKIWEAALVAAEVGELRPGHLCAFRPS